MNFTTLTGHVQVRLRQLILMGLLLPVTSAAMSILLIRRLERRLGIGDMGRPSR